MISTIPYLSAGVISAAGEIIEASTSVRIDAHGWGRTTPTWVGSGGSIFVSDSGSGIWSSHTFSLNIPQGATIISADFVPYARNNSNWDDTTNITFGAEQADDPTPLSSGDYNTRRQNVSNEVVWTPSGIGTVLNGNAITGGNDLSSVVQEIVDRPGWSSGNNINLVTEAPSLPVATSYSWHGMGSAESLRPRLDVVYQFVA